MDQIEKFIKRRLDDIRHYRTNKISPGTGLLVKKVAPNSIASWAGVEKDDILRTYNDQDASELDLETGTIGTMVQYLFDKPRMLEVIEFGAIAGPLGIDLELSTRSFEEQFVSKKIDVSELRVLWHRKVWRSLEYCCESYLRSDVLGKVSLRRSRMYDTPATLYLGASLFEQGKRTEGLNFILDYYKHHERKHTLDHIAVTRYYLARVALLEKDLKKAVHLLMESYQLFPLVEVKLLLNQLTGQELLEMETFVGDAFPTDYQLPILGEQFRVSLSKELAMMRQGQVMVICLLVGYRANGPYFDFMKRFAWLNAHFEDFLHRLHVITENDVIDDFSANWLGWEARARELRLPFDLLLDEEGILREPCDPKGSPQIFILDRQGGVLFEGSLLKQTDWWEAVNRAQFV